MRRLLLLLVCAAALGMGIASAGTLPLPDSTARIAADAFRGDTSVTAMELPDGITAIGDNAFLDTGITEVTLPDGLALENIGADAFPQGTFIYGSQDGLEAWSESQGYRYRRYFALVIGQTYEGVTGFEDSELTACGVDADAMSAMLKSQDATPFSVTKKVNLTAQEILSAISSAFAEADDGDICVFYYSGHGLYASEYPQYTGALVGTNLHYIGDDEKTHSTLGGAVPLQALRDTLDGIQGTKVIIMDSCYSGYMVDVMGGDIVDEDGNIVVRSDEDTEVNLSACSRAVISAFSGGFSSRSGDLPDYLVITASSDAQYSYTSYPGSLFTHYFVRGSGYSMSTASAAARMYADSDGNSRISQKEAVAYIWSKVNREIQVVQAYPAGGMAFDLWGRK